VLPVLRPLIGMDKIEITDQARQLDTLEISNEPDADCCTLFVPAHPSTRLSQEEVADMEARLDIPALVRAGVEAATMEMFDFPQGAGAHPPLPKPRRSAVPPPVA
jgi:thiamine biosynthesis protein ThiI